MNSEPEFWRPEREETDADDAKDDDGANAPVVPGNGVVQPHVGVRCVQENLKSSYIFKNLKNDGRH